MDALYSAFDFLIHPTFFDPDNPPLKVHVNAKTMGLVSAILGAIGLLLLLFAIPVVLAIGTVATGLYALAGQTHPGILVVAMIGLIFSLFTTAMWTYGGWQLYKENARGRDLIIVSLALHVVATLIYDIGTASIGGIIWTLVIDGLIYYFVRISRLPGEGRLVPAVAASAPEPWVPGGEAPVPSSPYSPPTTVEPGSTMVPPAPPVPPQGTEMPGGEPGGYRPPGG